MKIDNSFMIDAPISEAWALLTDIAEIAPCLPGAKLTDETDEVFTGSVKVKVGPVTAEYKGTAEFVERDDDAHRAVIDGKGRDSRGAGNAQALITAEMFENGTQTQVDISTDLKITGKVAQFGRGVMQDVSEKLLGQFAECLATKLEGTTALEDIATESAAADQADDDGAVPRDAAAAGAAGVAAGLAGKAASTTARQRADASNGADDDDDALDLLDVAGGAVFKRLVPIALLVALIIVVLIIAVG